MAFMVVTQKPRIVVLAGINGAGKTTASRELLTQLNISVFTNADLIARGLNMLNPESVGNESARVMLEWMQEITEKRLSFAFETTLSGKTYVQWLKKRISMGYEIRIYYSWLESSELAIGRVANRVKSGGHHVQDHIVRQRYQRSVWNFLNLYQPLADFWEVYDNSSTNRKLIAIGEKDQNFFCDDEVTWQRIIRSSQNVVV